MQQVGSLCSICRARRSEPSRKDAGVSNVLHLLASPDAEDEDILKVRQRIFHFFVDRGVDPDATNDAGKSASELFETDMRELGRPDRITMKVEPPERGLV